MLVANARMYEINAVAAAAWRMLLEWVFTRAGVDGQLIDYPPPQPLPSLWARSDLGCVFMCGYPYAQAMAKPTLLAAPVPSPPAYGGQPIYWSNLIVRGNAPFRKLEDTFGHRIAYTTEESQSGYQAPRASLAPYASAHGGRLFAEVVGPLLTPRRVIEAILAGDAAVGPLDSYAHDLLRAHEPEVASRLRTIATTAPTPIPPLVAAPGVDAECAEGLRAALLAVAEADELAPTRAALRLARFAVVAPERYDALLESAREADALGYRRLQ